MKIALIVAPYPLDEAPSPPLGLSYVAAACIAAGAEVILIDYAVDKYSPGKLAQTLDAFQPDAVGTTSVTMNFNQAIRIIQDVNAYNPDIITMMGGPHVSFDIENILKGYPELDLIVYGEAEDTLAELIPQINACDKWENIQGIAFRSGEEVVITPPRPLITDLDRLPLPARHLLPMSRYQALGFPVSIITSRGCPNQCIFCLGRRMVGRKPRFRNPPLVVDEIEHILEYGVDRINIADDLFTANKKRVKALCNEIVRRKVNFTWTAFARVNTVNLEILEIMKEAGCETISFGIESGVPEILKTVKKGITVEQIRNAVKWTKQAGLGVHASFMAGLPGESLETLDQTDRLASSLGINYGYHFLAPFPGTTVREEIDNYDLQILTDNWDYYDANQAIVRTSKISPAEMDAFVAKVYHYIDQLVAEREIRYLEGRCTDGEKLMVEGRRRMLLIYKLLTEDIIDDKRIWTVNGEDTTSLFIAYIVYSIKMEADFVESTVKDLIAAGYLKCEMTSHGARWFWTHNNRADRFKIP